MAKNVSRKTDDKPENPSRSSVTSGATSNGLLRWLDRRFNMGRIIGQELPTHQFYYAVWVAFLLLVYIYFSHRAEGLLRETERLRQEVGDLRAEYIATKAAFMKESKQSEIAKKVAPMGLKESKKAPIKIIDD